MGIAGQTPIRKTQVLQRAKKYRERGVPLRSLQVKRVNWEDLAEFAELIDRQEDNDA